MSLALRASDRQLALARRGPAAAALWHPEPLLRATYRVWRACVDDEIERLRIRFHNGPLADSIPSRGMMMTRRDIAINDGDDDWHDWDNTILCPFLTHELRHPVEARYLKPAGTFQVRYATNPRFRWASEMQGDIAVVRWRRKMRMRRVNVLRWAERRARAHAEPFPGYALGRIANLRAETVGLLMAVFDGEIA